MSDSDITCNERRVGLKDVVSDTPTPEKASLRSKQLSQKRRKVSKRSKRPSPTKKKPVAVVDTPQSPTQQLLACASRLEQIFNTHKIEDCAREEIRELFLQTHSIRDRQIAFWKNSATKARDEAIENSKALKQVAQEATEVKKSFSEVLKKGAPTASAPKTSRQAPPKPKVQAAKTPRIVPPSRPVVLVYAKIEALEDSVKLKKLLEKNVSLEKEGIKLLSSRPINKGLAITPANKESAEKLAEALTTSEALQGKIVLKSPVQKNPWIVVYDLDKSDCRSREKEEKKFLSLLAKDNHLPEGNMQVRFRLKGRGSKEHWVIEVDPNIRKALDDQRRVLAGFSTYRFKDYLEPIQCFKCYKYGHLQSKCTESEQCCSTCPDKHSYKTCKRDTASCRNCLESNSKNGTKFDVKHCAVAKDCPVYQKEKIRVQKSTHYEQ
ncbi:uncharacterized protein CDAR_553561 [Caerostris darwini]|uniref:CCHC-type domain-containing protein n=1 Tax=Caerostris darwini TaxID=1538125 RepID=A0AAV4V9N3_9ARAC|nr:uncharacterized protein CDAR_553561 [Caerostris darwini]